MALSILHSRDSLQLHPMVDWIVHVPRGGAVCRLGLYFAGCAAVRLHRGLVEPAHGRRNTNDCLAARVGRERSTEKAHGSGSCAHLIYEMETNTEVERARRSAQSLRLVRVRLLDFYQRLRTQHSART